jgi:pimeloyl-ACP methyl ester carboxylesterase
VDQRRIKTNGVELDVTVAGPSSGPLVILLHGFPELAHSWRKQIPALAEHGYWVWAPDQRGYNESDKPAGLASYRIDVLADDVLGLIDSAGRDRAVLVGHDWGAAVAWRVAQEFPERVARLMILDGPHPRAMRRVLRTHLRQLLMSWYMFVFQVPGIERLLLARGAERMVRGLRRTSREGTFDDEQIAIYRRAWEQPGAMRAMLDWYRAAFRLRARPSRHRRVSPPTLVVWGAHDAFVGLDAAKESVALCDDGAIHVIDEGTHWIHIEEPLRLNELMLSFLGGKASE